MHSIIYAKGSDIYAAFVRGAEQGYNRSTDKYERYEMQLATCYKKCQEKVGSRELRRLIRQKTKGDWRNAYLPLSFLQYHKYKKFQRVDTHARVYLSTDPYSVVDIPLADWKKFEELNPKPMV